ncbi:hypothetical protein GCM10010365_75970 [Streptomyces poonensis]|uniref:Uncharacterized protein n=1 Tax=Streptomyces poonensis TaxID=68255 RepID=A0A918UYH0_9ACTN|nr:hypothetical protein GCM10010365_75970 [Streptomyces poonensis]
MSKLEVPRSYTHEQWQEYVKRGRRIMRSKSASNFELGDLLNEIIDAGPIGHGEVTDLLTLFAAQIRSSHSSLRKYRTVARAWPTEQRRADVPWSVHRALAAVPDRFSLIREEPSDELDPAGRGHWTHDAGLRARDSMPHTPHTPGERIGQAKRLLRVTEEAAEALQQLAERTEVIGKAMENPAFRQTVRDAQRDVHLRLEAERGRQDPPEGSVPAPRSEDPLPGSTVEHRKTPTAVLRILGQCTSFCVGMQNAVIAIQEELLTTEHHAAVLESLGKVRAVCDWCEQAVTTGRTDVDEALIRLMDEEQDGGGLP